MKNRKPASKTRLADPTRNWKFSASDLAERVHWDEYQDAYEKVIRNTSSGWAPWHIVPANYKWYRNLVVAELVVATLEKLELAYPKADKELLAKIKVV